MDITNSGAGKTAHWEPIGDFGGYAKVFKCSCCGAVHNIGKWVKRPEETECSTCGAKMVVEEE